MLLEGKINKPNVIMRSIHLQLITKRVTVFLDFILQVIKLLIVSSDYKYALLLYVRNNDNTNA